jgi:iron complex transport system substrate-binding protein
LGAASLYTAPTHAQPAAIKRTVRIVTLGAAITEIAFAVGVGDDVVAVSRGATYPPASRRLPVIGTGRSVTAEPVLAQRPTIVLADSGVSPSTVEQLRGLGIRVVVTAATSAERSYAQIMEVATALGKAADGATLAARVRREVAAVTQRASAQPRPRALLIYARGTGTVFVAGRKTGADEMLRLAGATNAVAGFSDYKPLTAEAVAASGADAIVFLSAGLESIGGVDGALKLPGVAATPAGRARRIVAVDDQLLLSFGPRLAEGLWQLVQQLHPALTREARPRE